MNLNSLKNKLSPEGKPFPKIYKVLIYAGIALIIVGAICYMLNRAGYIQAFKYGLQFQQQQAQQEADKKVLDSLKNIMLLPEDILPTMAIINDADLLKEEQESFFANAKNGDRLIIYPNLAIIYDYQANRIIQVGSVSTDFQEYQEVGEEKTSITEENSQAPVSENPTPAPIEPFLE